VSEQTFESSAAGDPVEVTYLPAEPTKSRLGSPEPQLLIPLIVIGAGAIFAVVGTGLFALTLRIRKHGPPAWVHISTGAAPDSSSDASSDTAPDPVIDPVAYFRDEATLPVADRPPMSDAELRALDARLAPPGDEPSSERQPPS
jgi:hypothetical protein